MDERLVQAVQQTEQAYSRNPPPEVDVGTLLIYNIRSMNLPDGTFTEGDIMRAGLAAGISEDELSEFVETFVALY